jgi:hypothetical protein
MRTPASGPLDAGNVEVNSSDMPALDLANQGESTLNYQDQSRRLMAFDDLTARRITLGSFTAAKKRRRQSPD